MSGGAKRRWGVNFAVASNNRKIDDAPPGYKPNFEASEASGKGSERSQRHAKVELAKKRARAVAMSPGKNVMMTMFMMWMAGNSVHIFSIMITGYTAFGAIKGMLAYNAPFQRFEGMGIDLLQDKLLYIAIQFAVLCIALYKCNNLGILPTSSSDFSFRYPIIEPLEHTSL